MRVSKGAALGYAAILGVAACLVFAHYLNIRQEFTSAKQHFAEAARSDAVREAHKVETAFRSIYENIRTISRLPSVINIDRHGDNLNVDGRATIQQVYNNLANSVAVSEVYILPVDFDAARTDPVTGKSQAPIIMFDQLIVDAGRFSKAANPFAAAKQASGNGQPKLEEVETFEYRQLKTHEAWLKAHYPDLGSISKLDVPMISGQEVITCDNTYFATTGKDADRSGLIFSVPFYGADGALKGSVSAIILSNAVRDFLPPRNYALVNTAYDYVSRAHDGGQEQRSGSWVAQGKPDPRLIASDVIDLKGFDPRSTWRLWSGLPDSAFFGGAEFKRIRLFEIGGYLAIALLTLAAAFSWHLHLKSQSATRAKLQQANEAADAIREAHDKTVAAEQEARQMAEQLQLVNSEIGTLNQELKSNIEKLSHAQDEIIRKGRMAQLGQLTATVAHDIRNPLGAVLTSAFLIERRFKATNPGIEKPLGRITSGIKRCDSIISQLLDFARSKQLQKQELDVDDWVAKLVQEEAEHLPAEVAIECRLGLGDLKVHFDPGRLSRAIVNFMSNAAEAMIGKGSARPEVVTHNPQIVVATALTRRGIEISVCDNGPGISEENMKKILEPMFTTKNFGTGLGLPAVEKILEQHGGGLDIASTPGKGATFTGWFPVDRSQAEAA